MPPRESCASSEELLLPCNNQLATDALRIALVHHLAFTDAALGACAAHPCGLSDEALTALGRLAVACRGMRVVVAERDPRMRFIMNAACAKALVLKELPGLLLSLRRAPLIAPSNEKLAECMQRLEAATTAPRVPLVARIRTVRHAGGLSIEYYPRDGDERGFDSDGVDEDEGEEEPEDEIDESDEDETWEPQPTVTEPKGFRWLAVLDFVRFCAEHPKMTRVTDELTSRWQCMMEDYPGWSEKLISLGHLMQNGHRAEMWALMECWQFPEELQIRVGRPSDWDQPDEFYTGTERNEGTIFFEVSRALDHIGQPRRGAGDDDDDDGDDDADAFGGPAGDDDDEDYGFDLGGGGAFDAIDLEELLRRLSQQQGE
jgi:hypothetical protein